MITLLALYSFGGLLLAGLSVPLVLQRIPPNRWFGFPVAPNPEIPNLWYQVNAHAGRRFLAAGIGTAIGAIILYYIFIPNVQRYALSCLGVLLAFCLWAALSTFLYLRSLQALK